ncbi:MAG: hypothetical protein AAFN81_23585 [Bacteroidota bacterium]
MDELTEQDKTILALIGIAIARYPASFASLLKVHGYTITEQVSSEQLGEKVFAVLSSRDKRFEKALATLLQELISAESFDSFAADPISAVAGAVSSIGSVLNQGAQNKAIQIQARQQTMNGVLAYRQYQQQLAGQRQAQQQSKQRFQQIIRLNTILAGIGLLGLFVYLTFKKAG